MHVKFTFIQIKKNKTNNYAKRVFIIFTITYKFEHLTKIKSLSPHLLIIFSDFPFISKQNI